MFFFPLVCGFGFVFCVEGVLVLLCGDGGTLFRSWSVVGMCGRFVYFASLVWCAVHVVVVEAVVVVVAYFAVFFVLA